MNSSKKKQRRSVLDSFKTVVSVVTFLLSTMLFMSSCTKEQAVPIDIDFSIEVVNNDFSVPVLVKITNKTVGADTYEWTFEGAETTSSTKQNPGTIIYKKEGNFVIKLTAMNRDGIIETKEIPVAINDEIVTDFTATVIKDNYSPMEVAFTNTTVGATTYKWSFENGSIAGSTSQNPANVVFTTPGNHKVTLEVSNGKETYQIEKTVTVAPYLEAAFGIELAFEDDDLQAPVSVTTSNNSISATSYSWSCTGASPSVSTAATPKFTFEKAGIYTIKLEASNGKETKTVSKTITALANTNLRTFNDVKLGINTAHNSNTIGAFFSTQLRERYTSQEVNSTNGSLIDIAFYGLNGTFSFNKFLSPDQVQTLNFDAIPNATHTQFINSQESCNCSTSLSVSQFDSMKDDALLSGLGITETTGGLKDFDSSKVPRIILFKTQDGRKGAIKIKSFEANGVNSFIVVDIKVMKQ
ncbi:PKD domain-containing protein [Flavobacterium sp.]|uniref:PKD domain-containing protein n=1 Tax=Flavobacterium sp. TaxID=239 RepID=UPI00260F328B|nr:PKD domain-containing protein [Flavobacterium sp.]MDG2431389.1 PKD domain-containing protein [Flavobacterium sp.]